MSKKDTPEELYDGITHEEWVKELAEDNHWNKRHLYALFAMIGAPSSMLDIGCGLGELVYIANHMQITCYGVDQLVNDEEERYKPSDWYLHHDLRTPFSLREHRDIAMVDLVICWEVAEHIPDDALDIFCDTVCNHLRRDSNSLLAFTAAHPGQSGSEHVNARPSIFWREQFHERGLNFEEEKTSRLSLLWSNLGSPKYWLASNLQLFSK